jgi:hypothetical protein
MDLQPLETVISSGFQRSYREKVKAKQTFDALPLDVRKQFSPEGKAKALHGMTEKEKPKVRRLEPAPEEDGKIVGAEVKDDD